MVIHFAKRLLVSSEESVSKLANYIPEKHGEIGLLPETMKAQHESLAPGKDLEEITKGMLGGIMKFLDSREDLLARGQEVELSDFFRTFITIASTEAVYGAERNPSTRSSRLNSLLSYLSIHIPSRHRFEQPLALTNST